MSTISFRPRGGMQGIEVSDEELDSFANSINSKYLDAIIPLPNVSLEDQKIRLESGNCTCHLESAIYYERLNGRHGWCCEYCGKVVQWG